MTDVRLTATNPVDSSVVPVACNEKGELLLEEPSTSSDVFVAKAGDTMTGNLHLGDGITLNPDGSAQLASGGVDVYTTGKVILGDKITLDASDGSAMFASGNIVLNSGLNGSAMFASDVETGTFTATRGDVARTPVIQTSPAGNVIIGDASQIVFTNAGSATFAGDVIIGSRGKKWMIVESNGLAHLVEQTLFLDVETADLADNRTGNTQYPPLRDIPGELTMVEEQLQKVLEKLRMVPEAGWEVWDGSDNI